MILDDKVTSYVREKLAQRLWDTSRDHPANRELQPLGEQSEDEDTLFYSADGVEDEDGNSSASDSDSDE